MSRLVNYVLVLRLLRFRHCLRQVETAWRQRVSLARQAVDAGMSTAEYAVGTVAACGFAALLWAILHSGAVQSALAGLITKALTQL